METATCVGLAASPSMARPEENEPHQNRSREGSQPSTARSDSDSLEGLVSEIRCKRPPITHADGSPYASPSPPRGTSLVFNVHPRSLANNHHSSGEGALVVTYQNTGLDLLEAMEQDKLETTKQQAAQATMGERIAEELRLQRELAVAKEDEALRQRREREAMAMELAAANDKLSRSFYTVQSSPSATASMPCSPPLSALYSGQQTSPQSGAPSAAVMVTTGTNTSPARPDLTQKQTVDEGNTPNEPLGERGSVAPVAIELSDDVARASKEGVGRRQDSSVFNAGSPLVANLEGGQPASYRGGEPSPSQDAECLEGAIAPIQRTHEEKEPSVQTKHVGGSGASSLKQGERRRLAMDNNEDISNVVLLPTSEVAATASESNGTVCAAPDRGDYAVLPYPSASNRPQEVLVLDRSSNGHHGGTTAIDGPVVMEGYIVERSHQPNAGETISPHPTVASSIQSTNPSRIAATISTQTENEYIPASPPQKDVAVSPKVITTPSTTDGPNGSQRLSHVTGLTTVDIPPQSQEASVKEEDVVSTSSPPVRLPSDPQVARVLVATAEAGTITDTDNIIIVSVQRGIETESPDHGNYSAPLSPTNGTDSNSVSAHLEGSLLGRGSALTSAQREALGIEDITFEVSSYAQTDSTGPLHPPPDPARASASLFADLIRERDEQGRPKGGGQKASVKDSMWAARHGDRLDKSGLVDDDAPIDTEDEDGYEGEAGFIHHNQATDEEESTYANATVDSDIDTSGFLYRSKMANRRAPAVGLGIGKLNFGAPRAEANMDGTTHVMPTGGNRRQRAGRGGPPADEEHEGEHHSPIPTRPRVAYEEAPDEDWLKAIATAEAVAPSSARAADQQQQPPPEVAHLPHQTPDSSGVASAPSVLVTANPSPEMAAPRATSRATVVEMVSADPMDNYHRRLDSTADGDDYQPPTTDDEGPHVRFGEVESDNPHQQASIKVPGLNVQAAQNVGANGAPSARVADTARYQPTTGRPGGMARFAPPMSPNEGDTTDRRPSYSYHNSQGTNQYNSYSNEGSQAPPLPSWVSNTSDPQGAAETSRDTSHLDRNQLVALLADIRSQLGTALAGQAMYRSRSERFATQLTNRTTELSVVSQFLEQSQNRNVELARILNDMTERAVANNEFPPMIEQQQKSASSNGGARPASAARSPQPQQQQPALSRNNSFNNNGPRQQQQQPSRGFERMTSSTSLRANGQGSFNRSATGFTQQTSPSAGVSRGTPSSSAGSPSKADSPNAAANANTKRVSALKSPAANLAKSMTNGGFR